MWFDHQSPSHGSRLHVFEPSHEIIALLVLPKLILQMRMRSHPMGLDVWLLVGPFIYFHTPWAYVMYHNLMSQLICLFVLVSLM